MPTGFRTVDYTWSGIANNSLENMGRILEEADDAVRDATEELPLSTLTYHNSIMSYLGAILENGSSKLIIWIFFSGSSLIPSKMRWIPGEFLLSKLIPLKYLPSVKMTHAREYFVSGGKRTDLGMSFRLWKL